MSALKTYSAGIFLYHPGSHSVLMVQEYGTYWGLPRGHIEAGEEPELAARRELQEETGVQFVCKLTKIGSYERYTFGEDGVENNNELKHITIYLGKVENRLKLQPKDSAITNAEWVLIRSAEDRLLNDKDRKFMKQCVSAAKKLSEVIH